MNPDVNSNHIHELPRPEAYPVISDSEQSNTERSYELSHENKAQPAQTSPMADPQASPAQNPIVPQGSVAPIAQVSSPSDQVDPINLPVQAEDIDLIEKEWVERAKHIVNQTRNDPHMQNKEINKMKAEYIKKRYNKELKTSDD